MQVSLLIVSDSIADKTGKVKTDLFFQICELNKIELTAKDKQYLKKLH
jgi:hypothetical protein